MCKSHPQDFTWMLPGFQSPVAASSAIEQTERTTRKPSSLLPQSAERGLIFLRVLRCESGLLQGKLLLMDSSKILDLGILILMAQVFVYGSCEDETLCQSGFNTELFVFKVHKIHLHRGSWLGKVTFDDCSGRQRFLFSSEDSRFKVDTDGTVYVKRAVTLHDGHKSFSVHAWDSNGKKITSTVRIQHEITSKQESVTPEQLENSQPPLVLEFPKSSAGLRRRKREWVISPMQNEPAETPAVQQFPKGNLIRKKRDWETPPLSVSENQKGPFPKEVWKLHSSKDKEVKIVYSITGPGADQDPKGVFIIDAVTGLISVTRMLDREKQDQYELTGHATTANGQPAESPNKITISVTDQNDNKPIFTQDTFEGSLPEASPKDTVVLQVTATDADDPSTTNAELRYSIVSQDPTLPNGQMFAIDSISGEIQLSSAGLDKEKYPRYTLTVTAADLAGEGFSTSCKVIIKVTDSNDNAPQFTQPVYNASVRENIVNAEVVTLTVTDVDDADTPAWFAKYKIIQGDDGGFFNISTAPNRQDGIITTVKPLDFEKKNKYTLLVTAENEIPFVRGVETSTATVVVNVEDVNEAPTFNPHEKLVSVPENLPVGEKVTQYTATDPDTRRKQTLGYRINDPAGWLAINKDTGDITVQKPMDRESLYITDGKYKVQVVAFDNDVNPATGTGTLVIEMLDVNDNPPTIDQRQTEICNEEPEPVQLSVTDKDGPQFGPPFKLQLRGQSNDNWTIINDPQTGITLVPKKKLPQNYYNVVITAQDIGGESQDSTIRVLVCDCKGKVISCNDKYVAGMDLSGILGILAGIMLLLLLVLLLLIFLRRKPKVKEEPLLQDDDVRDNVYYYDEEGGGEDDQEYDLSQLHRGLDNRPDVFRNDVAPTFMPAPQYRPRPANPDEIGNFIEDNLKAADNDPTAPPYDSLLVFDYEGGGSDAGSLSSLNSTSSGGDQDYDCMNQWGPRFKKLADMYGGGDD